jgi:hypothetical protein
VLQIFTLISVHFVELRGGDQIEGAPAATSNPLVLAKESIKIQPGVTGKFFYFIFSDHFFTYTLILHIKVVFLGS